MIAFLVGEETVSLPVEDALRLLAELRRVALLQKPGVPMPKGAVAATIHLERLIEKEGEEAPIAVLVLEATGLLPAVEALEAEQRLSPALEQLYGALTRLTES